ncbi:MAG TPA: hypothetical protein VD906_14095 [Caulobacteraceae bacterium]|nr:hypothetical protein [Caulobacteraceae bacterium]
MRRLLVDPLQAHQFLRGAGEGRGRRSRQAFRVVAGQIDRDAGVDGEPVGLDLTGGGAEPVFEMGPGDEELEFQVPEAAISRMGQYSRP